MKFFGYALTVLGICFLIGAIYLCIDHSLFMSKAKLTTGEVVGIDVVRKGRGNSWVPIIKFLTEQNEEIIVKPNLTLSPPYTKDDFKVGQKIQIRYDPKHPQKIFFLPFFENWGMMLVISAVGVIVIITGVTLVKILNRRKRLYKR